MDPLMVDNSVFIVLLMALRKAIPRLTTLLRLLEYIQCLPPLRPHPLCPRYSRLNCVCPREQEPGDIDE